MGTSLTMLAENLSKLAKEQEHTEYHIPTLWLNDFSANGDSVITNPAQWLYSIIKSILKKPYNDKENNRKKYSARYYDGWLHDAKIYSLYVRHFSAYDHDGDGSINPFLSANGWRETGTFIKCIAALPYIQSLGIDTIHLLPVTQHGNAYKKGNLGSPYAIADHYALDPQLGETILWLSIEHQFSAFIEAAHRVGIRVIAEFAFRTMSRDTELAIQHPDWFYWIRSEDASTYAKPDFSNETLSEIHARIQLQNFTHLPAPDESYKNKFVQALSSVRTDTGEIQGITSDGTVCVLPPAFADYPPNDPQPSWDDITYLKFHTHASFNYVAYNTIRIYDEELQNPDTFSAPLWKHIEGVVFTWKKNYNLDGAFLDMSHALPYQLRRAIMKRARRTDEAFAFIDESFDISATAQEQGFNAVVGNVWLAAQRIDTLLERLDGLRNSTTTVSFLATPDTHNTPRVAMRHGTDDIKSIYSLLSDIPNGIPFVTSGSEFGERTPINTGLTFSNEETETYPASRLPLFSSCALDWKNADAEIINHIRSLFR